MLQRDFIEIGGHLVDKQHPLNQFSQTLTAETSKIFPDQQFLAIVFISS